VNSTLLGRSSRIDQMIAKTCRFAVFSGHNRNYCEYKKFLNDLTRDELLAYVCSAYPDMTEESVEYENLKPNMENHILSLIKKQKISSQRAAELLNKPQDYVIRRMKDERIGIIHS